MFGRKQAPPATAPASTPPPPVRRADAGDDRDHPGHRAVLRTLNQMEKEDPLARLRLAGKIVYDLFVQILGARDHRVRIEDLIAALASNGGHLCLVGVMDDLARRGLSPHDVGIVELKGHDGHHYFFGDEPNRLLLESPNALLSLVLGAAHAHGAPVSLEMAHEAMKRTAASAGKPEFGKPALPDKHLPALSSFDWVRHSRRKMIEALDLYDVPPLARPAAVGFALQRAIDESRTVIEPLMATRIAIECAVPMAKIDPRRFAAD